MNSIYHILENNIELKRLMDFARKCNEEEIHLAIAFLEMIKKK